MNYKLHYTPVLLSEELVQGKPLRVYLDNKPVVLIRNNSTVNAFFDYCPHRGAPLSKGFIHDNQIHCPYHGWSFSCSEGTNTNVPVKNSKISCKLTKVFALEKHEIIWLCFSKDGIIPNLTDESPNILLKGSVVANISNVLENFLEGSHTHYIHDGLIRSKKAKRHQIKATFIPTENGFEVHYPEEEAKGFITKLTPKKFQNLRSVATFIYPNIAMLAFYNKENILVSRFEGIFGTGNKKTLYFARVFLDLGILNSIVIPFAKKLFIKVINQDIQIMELQEENLKEFSDLKFTSDETDLVGEQIFAWMTDSDKKLKSSKQFNVFW